MATKHSDAEARRQKLADDVQRFLNSGGKITHIDPFVSGETGWKGSSSQRPCTRVQINQRIAPGIMM
ncbi:hypothetical protein CHH28_15535 [Bacterioplanes sanyensis]|uniref:Transcriptional regulator SutA RNAP-binding domain-containing protein n=1 Tax=Bacterioplanes sanyensis TaxID=1249553 RepID=A0A222FMM8_9GAMM|nr:hypothetical protein [Bacterioplanes sanyensis]ASP39999.1 hypothetical protein CHH28_15535 [Bacterioplanes sanyensis]